MENHYKRIIRKLTELNKKYPHYTISQHLGTALSDYRDIWGIPDKEVFLLLEKYESELELNIETENSVNKVVEDAMNLDTILDNEDQD